MEIAKVYFGRAGRFMIFAIFLAHSLSLTPTAPTAVAQRAVKQSRAERELSSAQRKQIQGSILRVLNNQVEAWNKGDIDGFMGGYWRSSETLFISGDDIMRGWAEVRDRYKRRYGSRELMGMLNFSDIQIGPLFKDSAVVTGSWHLKRNMDAPHGKFTLIFRLIEKEWKIICDSTT